MTGNSHHELTEGNSHLINCLPSRTKRPCVWMREEQWMSFPLTLERLSTLSLYPSWNVISGAIHNYRISNLLRGQTQKLMTNGSLPGGHNNQGARETCAGVCTV